MGQGLLWQRKRSATCEMPFALLLASRILELGPELEGLLMAFLMQFWWCIPDAVDIPFSVRMPGWHCEKGCDASFIGRIAWQYQHPIPPPQNDVHEGEGNPSTNACLMTLDELPAEEHGDEGGATLRKLSVRKDKERAGVVEPPSVIDRGALVTAPIELKHGKRCIEADTLDEGSGRLEIIARRRKVDGIRHAQSKVGACRGRREDGRQLWQLPKRERGNRRGGCGMHGQP